MNHKGVRIAMAAMFAIGLAASAFAQGLYMESTMAGTPAGDRHEQMWAMPKMMKSVHKETGEAIIIRLDKEVFITVDPNEKTYSEMTFAEMEGAVKKVGGKMDSKMAEMQKQLAGMPEEQRKMVEQMMKEKMGGMGAAKDAKVDVQKTDEKTVISGFSCAKFVITKDEKELMTIWATKGVNGFDAMRKDWEEFSTRMMAMNPMAGKSVGEAFKKIDGFPIRTEMGHGMMSTVTKVERKTTPAGDFEVPAGYKKVKSKMAEEMEKMNSEENQE